MTSVAPYTLNNEAVSYLSEMYMYIYLVIKGHAM